MNRIRGRERKIWRANYDSDGVPLIAPCADEPGFGRLHDCADQNNDAGSSQQRIVTWGSWSVALDVACRTPKFWSWGQAQPAWPPREI